MVPVARYELGGKVVKVYVDPDPGNPLDEPRLAKLFLYHRRHSLGEKEKPDVWKYHSWEQLGETLEGHVLPVYAYDHGNFLLSLNTFEDRFDSAQIGFAVVADEEWDAVQDPLQAVKWELERYEAFLNGWVFGYEVEVDDGESGWGFYGTDHRKNGLLEAAFGKDWQRAAELR